VHHFTTSRRKYGLYMLDERQCWRKRMIGAKGNSRAKALRLLLSSLHRGRSACCSGCPMWGVMIYSGWDRHCDPRR